MVKKGKARKTVPARRKKVPVKNESEGPQYMVQVNEPKMLRKDLLESLREIIIFMQGYEKFRQIQTEKVNLFNSLKTDVKELNTLIEHKLKKYFPQGKLKAVMKEKPKEESFDDDEESKVEVFKEEPKKKMVAPVSTYQQDLPSNELDELESQLKDIEGQLRSIQ